MLLILYIISIAQVTRRGGIVSPGHSFNLKGVCAFHPVCNAINVVQLDGEQQRGEGTSLFNP